MKFADTKGSSPPVAAVAPRPATAPRNAPPGWNDPPPMEPRRVEPKRAEIPPPVSFPVVGANDGGHSFPPQFAQSPVVQLNGNSYSSPNQQQNGFGHQVSVYCCGSTQMCQCEHFVSDTFVFFTNTLHQVSLLAKSFAVVGHSSAATGAGANEGHPSGAR
jgi:hypothetical protein